MIEFHTVSKHFERKREIIKNISFQVYPGEIMVLLGKSGSGKSTILKMINRLIEPSCGEILVDGVRVIDYDLVQLRRKIGMSVQGSGLFPHMTVEENIGIVLRLMKWKKERIRERVRELLDLIGLSHGRYLEAYPHQLSGGEKQRVGVARALATEPNIMLMDEPFGALDPLMREQIQKDFLKLASQLNMTVVFVTHDIIEAMILGDRIGIIEGGELLQIGTPVELIQNPASSFVSEFIQSTTFQMMFKTNGMEEFAENMSTDKEEIIPILEKEKQETIHASV